MQQQIQRWFRYLAWPSGLLGILWLLIVYGWQPEPVYLSTPTQQTELTSGGVATMDSAIFEYSPGWVISPNGADTQEPADPWQEPSGIVTFQYQGQELVLQLAVGNYWGYLYVTVDGEPANLLPNIANNHNRKNEAAGYRTFYVPEKQNPDGSPTAVWVPVHRASSNGLHNVEVEIWRSWGQVPLRGVAIDGLPESQRPVWPGVALLIAAMWLWLLGNGTQQSANEHRLHPSSSTLEPAKTIVALCAVVLLIIGVRNQQWYFALSGYSLFAIVALWQPALWIAMLFFSLPFYFEYDLPLLPNRSFNLIEMGILGGVAITVGRELLGKVGMRFADGNPSLVERLRSPSLSIRNPMLWLWALVSWALISALAANYADLALREWRTVFLASGLISFILIYTLQSSTAPISLRQNRTLIIGAWLVGGTVVSLVALWHYISGTSLITAEDVSRVRAFYGSPNNLALYLDRTVMVGAALMLFSKGWKQRLLWGALALPQAAALLLTYSRGAIILGIPTGCLVLIVGGWWLSKNRDSQLSKFNFQIRPLALIFLALLIGGAGLMTFSLLGTARLQQTFDFSQGTGFLRFQMWRSAWQMALDHPWLGVGPDNFLYTFRSSYILPAAWQEPDLNHPHNWILDFWTRLGTPGLLFGILFIGSTVIRLWRNLKNEHGPLALGMLAAICAALAHGLIDASYALPDLMAVWVLCCGIIWPASGNEKTI